MFSTDKSVWMQGRCAWTFAYLCHVYGVKEEWLEASKSCLDFMEKYCINRQAGRPHVLHRHRRRQAPAPAPLLASPRVFYAIANAGILRRDRGRRSAWSGPAGPMT